MPSLSQGGRRRNAQDIPFSRMARSQMGIPDAFRKWEQKSESLKEGMEMAKNFCDASSQ